MEKGKNCIFCKIIAGKAPASMVYQDKLVAAFLTIEPINPGHLLIVPKKHAPGLKDLDEKSAERMMKVAKKMASALRASKLRCEGVNLLLADGKVAYQSVFHVHLHVVPRFKGDNFSAMMNGFATPPRAPSAELDAVAKEIKKHA